MEKEKNIENNLDDVIFEKRNKDYGAYFLRKTYNRNVAVALTISIILTILIVAIPLIAIYIHRGQLMSAGMELMGIKEIKVEFATLPPPSVLTIPSVEKLNFKVPVVVNDTSDQLPISSPEELNEKGKNEKKDDGVAQNELNPNGKQVLGGGFGTGLFGYNVVSQKPFYPGGDEEMNNFIKTNIKYPDLARTYKIQGTIFITLIVETDGSLTNIKILKGIGAGCDEEAERVVKLMPRWIPGKQNNQYVRVQVLIPIKFIVIPLSTKQITKL